MIEAAMFGVPYVPSERTHRQNAGMGGGGDPTTADRQYMMHGVGMGNEFPYQEYGGEYGERRVLINPPSEEVVMDRLIKEQQVGGRDGWEMDLRHVCMTE